MPLTMSAERRAHQETQAKLAELREALKYKQRGMTFTESERNAELVRQLAETQAKLATAISDERRRIAERIVEITGDAEPGDVEAVQDMISVKAQLAETQAKLDALSEPPDNEAWKSVIKYAYADGGDGVRNINSITSHYVAMRNKLEQSEKEISRLLALISRDCDAHIKQGVDLAEAQALVRELVEALDIVFAELEDVDPFIVDDEIDPERDAKLMNAREVHAKAKGVLSALPPAGAVASQDAPVSGGRQ